MPAKTAPKLTFERVFGSPSLNGPVAAQPQAVARRPLPGVAAQPRPTTSTATTSGRSTGRPASGKCWSIPKSSEAAAPLSEAEKMQRERTRHRQPEGHRHLRLVGGQQDDPGSARRRALPRRDRRQRSRSEGRRRGRHAQSGAQRDREISVVPARQSAVGRARRQSGQAGHAKGRQARPLGRGGVRRPGRDGPPHRLLVVADRLANCRRTVRRSAGRYRHPRGNRCRGHHRPTSSAILLRARPTSTSVVRHQPGRQPPGEGRPRAGPRHLPGARRLGARWQDAVRAARGPRPDHARHAGGQSVDRPQSPAIQREGGAGLTGSTCRATTNSSRTAA